MDQAVKLSLAHVVLQVKQRRLLAVARQQEVREPDLPDLSLLVGLLMVMPFAPRDCAALLLAGVELGRSIVQIRTANIYLEHAIQIRRQQALQLSTILGLY